MKIRLLSRNEKIFRENLTGSLLLRQTDLEAQPMWKMREYQRALQASKLERHFARPFVAAFSGHTDSVKSLCLYRNSIEDFFSGSCDGEIRYWNIASRRCLRSVKNAHDGFINALATSCDDTLLYSAGQDGTVKQWLIEKNFPLTSELFNADMPAGDLQDAAHGFAVDAQACTAPQFTFTCGGLVSGLDHSPAANQFLTCGAVVELWDAARGEAVSSFKWGNDQYVAVKYSPSEPNLFVGTAFDNAVTLFDLRVGNAVQKVYLTRRSNAISFNPMQPSEFAIANDDSNVYAFDLRNFAAAKAVYPGFVSAALDVSYSPTGRELVAGSFDQTVRVWPLKSRRAREVLHNKRMQAVLQVRYTHDAKYLLTGSADFNVRVWKSEASMLERAVGSREQRVLQYREALKERYKSFPEVNKILTKRQLPKYIHNQVKKRHAMSEAEKRREENRERHKSKEERMKPLKRAMVLRTALDDRPLPARARATDHNICEIVSAPSAAESDSELDLADL